jgi:hypothetical protein
VLEFLERHDGLERVLFACFDPEVEAALRQALDIA